MTDTGRTPTSDGDRPAVGHFGTTGADGYVEHLRVPALSFGRFIARPGYDKQQDPHTEDEVYYVIAGEAVLDIAGTPHPLSPGSWAYVPAGTEHRFSDVTTDLDVLVLFA